MADIFFFWFWTSYLYSANVNKICWDKKNVHAKTLKVVFRILFIFGKLWWIKQHLLMIQIPITIMFAFSFKSIYCSRIFYLTVFFYKSNKTKKKKLNCVKKYLRKLKGKNPESSMHAQKNYACFFNVQRTLRNAW